MQPDRTPSAATVPGSVEEAVELVRDRIRVDAGQAAAALLAATTEHFDKFPGDSELGLALSEAVTSLCDLAQVAA